MNLYLLIFFFIQDLLLFATNIVCNLSKAIKEILYINVTYNYNLIIKTNWKYLFFF
jgi:hypothetical protein